MSQMLNIDGADTTDNASCLPLLPRRPQWLRRYGLAVVVILVGVFLLRVIWGCVANHRLTAQLEQYRVANQPIHASEFNEVLDSVDERRNAAIRLEEAIEALVATSDSGVGFTSFLNERASFESNMPAAHELVKANAETFRLLREARDMPDVAWSSRLGNLDASPSLYSQQRLIAKLLHFATSYHFRNGNHDEAVAVLRDSLAFNNAVDSGPTLISSLVAWSCYGLSFGSLEKFLHGLQVGDTSKESTTSISAVPREEVESLLRELFVEDAMRRNVVRSCYGSRASTIHSLATTGIVDWIAPNSLGLLSGSPWKQIINVMVHPVLVLDTARTVRYDTIAATALTEEGWPDASRHFVPETVTADLLYRMTRPITYTQFGPAHRSSHRLVQRYFRALARRRMAAIAVAIRLYELDHGPRPSQLSLLEPTYIAKLPRDPLDKSNDLFGYRPDADRPFLYSVGIDGRDNDGQVQLRPDGRRDVERSDRVFYLEPELADSSAGDANDDHQDIEHK